MSERENGNGHQDGDGAESPETAERECANCGHVGEPKGKGQCRGCGCFLPANEVALVHGRRRERALISEEAAELARTWEADLGGRDALTAGKVAVLRQVARAESIAATAAAYLEDSGESLTAKRPQAAIANLLSAASVVFAGARLLGLERQAKNVPSLDEVLSGKATDAG